MTINVLGLDIWFRIRPNLGPFLVTFRFFLASSEVHKVPNFCYYMSGSPAICNFLSMINSNLGPILHRLATIHP